LQQAAQVMRSNDIGDVLVEDDEGRLLGILTIATSRSAPRLKGSDPVISTIADVYTRDVASVAPTDSVAEVVRRMKSSDVRRMPVVESGGRSGSSRWVTSRMRRGPGHRSPTSTTPRPTADRIDDARGSAGYACGRWRARTGRACPRGSSPCATPANVVNGDELPTVQSLADAVTTLTAGFGGLVEALDEGAAIVVDTAWAEASGGDEGGPDTWICGDLRRPVAPRRL
jgi:CBS domain-containing protein